MIKCGRVAMYRQRARYWEFIQYEPIKFGSLAHKHLEYSVYQTQIIKGRECIYGILHFSIQVSHGLVHRMIGSGYYCKIAVLDDPSVARISHIDSSSEYQPVTTGIYKKIQPVKKYVESESNSDSESDADEYSEIIKGLQYEEEQQLQQQQQIDNEEKLLSEQVDAGRAGSKLKDTKIEDYFKVL